MSKTKAKLTKQKIQNPALNVLAHVVAFNKVLVGTTVILLIGYTVIKLPFSYRMIKAASDESASVDARAMSFVYTVVLMILSSVALYFGQGNGMEKIRGIKQRRLERRVAKH